MLASILNTSTVAFYCSVGTCSWHGWGAMENQSDSIYYDTRKDPLVVSIWFRSPIQYQNLHGPVWLESHRPPLSLPRLSTLVPFTHARSPPPIAHLDPLSSFGSRTCIDAYNLALSATKPSKSTTALSRTSFPASSSQRTRFPHRPSSSAISNQIRPKTPSKMRTPLQKRFRNGVSSPHKLPHQPHRHRSPDRQRPVLEPPRALVRGAQIDPPQHDRQRRGGRPTASEIIACSGLDEISRQSEQRYLDERHGR